MKLEQLKETKHEKIKRKDGIHTRKGTSDLVRPAKVHDTSKRKPRAAQKRDWKKRVDQET